MSEMERVLKPCRECGIPKLIHCYSGSEWARSNSLCNECIRKRREAKNGDTGRTEEQKNWCREDFIISAKAPGVKGEQKCVSR